MIPNLSIFDVAADTGLSLDEAAAFVLDAEPVPLDGWLPGGLVGNAFYSSAQRRWYFANKSKLDAAKGKHKGGTADTSKGGSSQQKLDAPRDVTDELVTPGDKPESRQLPTSWSVAGRMAASMGRMRTAP